MISAICMNPCFDKTVDVDSLKPGQVNRIKNVRLDLGGKGINVAVVAERLGLEVQCIGIMGKEGGVELSDMMDREHLRHTFMEIPGHVRTNTKIFSRDGQGVTELNEPGTTVTPEQLQEFITLMRDETRGSDMVVLTGSLPPGCPEGTYCELMKALDGKRVILDTEGKELELAAKGNCPPPAAEEPSVFKQRLQAEVRRMGELPGGVNGRIATPGCLFGFEQYLGENGILPPSAEVPRLSEQLAAIVRAVAQSTH